MVLHPLALSLTAVPAHAQLPEIEREIADFDRQIQQNRELAQLKETSRGPIDDEMNKNQAALAELERRLSPLVIVHVLYERDAGQMVYRIVDEGAGLPWHRLLTQSGDAIGLEECSGRGIFLTRSLFPSLSYNERGNEATITVPPR